MSEFSVHKLICLKHIVLISLLSITSILILGCTCSKTEEPVVEQEQAIKEEPVGKKEGSVDLKPVEKPESIKSDKADSTETVNATPTQKPESIKSDEGDSDDVVWPSPIIETKPYEGNLSEKEQAGKEEAGKEEAGKEGADVYKEGEQDPCAADC
jgi:hypothetical protein